MTLLALIKREIYDHIAYFIGAIVFTAIMILLSIAYVLWQSESESNILSLGVAIPVIFVLILGFPAMGVTQMYIDKNRKISAFLLTLPTTRSVIFTAKIITGGLTMLVFFLPLIVTTKILFRLYGPPIPIYEGMIFEVSSGIILTAFACYCIGLQTGWKPSKFFPTFGGLMLIAPIVTVVIVKGFGIHTWIILGTFILASLIRSWQKFSSTPL